MPDRVTADLPARSLDVTARFCQRLGFAVDFKDQGWLIMARGTLELGSFPHPDLNPYESWFSACVRAG